MLRPARSANVPEMISQPKKQHRDNYVKNCRTGQRYPEFLDGFVGHTFQPGNPADRVKGDVASFDAITPGGESVAELVQHHTAKQEQREENAFQCSGLSSGLLPITQTLTHAMMSRKVA